MKSFTQFFTEARQTSASQQAKKLGLVGDGHGDWYDQQGNLVAKTVKGKLEFFGKGGAGATAQPAAAPQQAAQQAPQPQQAVSAIPQQQEPVQSTKQSQQQVSQQPTGELPPEEQPQVNGIVAVFGRFNPPTVGHEKLLKRAAKEANKRGYELRIYPSRSNDPKKNPLTPDLKISYMRQMFPDYADNIIDNKNVKTIFNVLTGANQEGHTNMVIMVGQDRLSEFQGLSHKYNGELYNYDNLEVVSAGERDPDADDVSGMSASKMRLAAAEGDFKKFAKGIPDTLGNMEKMELFNVLRRSMNLSEETMVWEISPELDPEGLRENYISGEIYPIGMMVENINTGLRGEIIRRGTNHVICVTENGIMFKSWLKDINEYTEVKMDRKMRGRNKPNTLVGTSGYFKFASQQTPGAVGTGRENLAPGQKPYLGIK